MKKFITLLLFGLILSCGGPQKFKSNTTKQNDNPVDSSGSSSESSENNEESANSDEKTDGQPDLNPSGDEENYTSVGMDPYDPCKKKPCEHEEIPLEELPAEYGGPSNEAKE